MKFVANTAILFLVIAQLALSILSFLIDLAQVVLEHAIDALESEA